MENYLPKCGNKKECNECRTVGPSFTGFFIEFYRVLLGFDKVGPGLTGLDLVLLGFYRVFIRVYLYELSFT